MPLARLQPHVICSSAGLLIDVEYPLPAFLFPPYVKSPKLRICDAVCTSSHNFERKLEAAYFRFVFSFLVLQYLLSPDTYAFLSCLFT